MVSDITLLLQNQSGYVVVRAAIPPSCLPDLGTRIKK